ncbi:MAG: ketoacyl-ACP synthase III [Lachnospiraceae bacterium]|nr:ketoacyl-ACP synthase III [Lachnospiraceae bacterium]
MRTRVIGTGRCLPETVVTNDDLSKIMDTSDEWISSRTGIKERRLVKTENTASMSVYAAQEAIKDAGIQPEDIDLIIVGTLTGDYVTPSTACEVQAAIGAVHAMAFDVNAACTGFIVALNTAHMYIQAGICRTALIIGAETLSKIMDWDDRGTCVLFGDGAGAAIVQSADTGILGLVQGADGTKGMSLACQDRDNHNPLVQSDRQLHYTSMNGQEVYKFAVTKVPECIHQVLDQANLTTEDVKYFILHQANIRIIQSVAKRLKVSEDKFPISLDHYGNISAASVPILLDEVNKKGLLQRGDKIVISGFGGGLTWGADVIEW